MSENHAALAASLHAKQDKMAPAQVNMRDITGRPDAQALDRNEPRAPGVMDEQFPTAALGAREERDRIMEAKLRLQTSGQPGYTPFGKLEATDKDFEWYQRKAAAVETAQFQAWFAHEFDRMSPADKKRAKELYPEFYAQRVALLEQQARNLFDIGRLKVEGVQSMDDLKTQYMLETGRLDLGPLQSLLHPEAVFSRQLDSDEARSRYAQAKFQRGLLAPFRVFGSEAVPTIDVSDNQPYTGLQMREWNAGNFRPPFPSAERATELSAGVHNLGFPPFGGNNVTNKGDLQWFQVLQQADLPRAAAARPPQ